MKIYQFIVSPPAEQKINARQPIVKNKRIISTGVESTG
jgi:hypothetical protein